MTKTDQLPKVLGADIELGNFVQGGHLSDNTGYMASRLLLRQIRGVRGYSYGLQEYNPQDIGRKWLSNGSCCYIDLDHLEICLPEVRSAWDFTASLHAQFQIVREARNRATESLQPGVSLHVLACNSDGNGSSWGSHLNFLVTRDCFSNIFHKRLHYLLWLASFHASSIIVTGQGKVGSENGAKPVDYQISQRADFLEEIVGLQTTFSRPIINSRDESLSAPSDKFARFHHIACDVNLCHVANVLKVGVLQILLTMIESESAEISADSILQDPVRACETFSHDPDLNAKEPMLSGEELSAVEIQRKFFDAAAAFVESGACEETVPRARDILALWIDTLEKLASKDWGALSRRLDWVLKRQFLQEVLQENSGLDWQSHEIKRLDLLYGSLDEAEGIYWSLEKAGCVDRMVTEDQIRHLMEEPPSDTRAFTRAHLIRAVGEDNVLEVDWDLVRVRPLFNRGGCGYGQTIKLDDPAGFTQSQTRALFELEREHRATVDEILTALAPPTAQPQTNGLVRADSAREDHARNSSRNRATTSGYMPWS